MCLIEKLHKHLAVGVPKLENACHPFSHLLAKRENTFITAQCSMGVSIHVNLSYGCGHYMTSKNHVIGDVDHMTGGRSCDRGCRSHDRWEIM